MQPLSRFRLTGFCDAAKSRCPPTNQGWSFLPLLLAAVTVPGAAATVHTDLHVGQKDIAIHTGVHVLVVLNRFVVVPVLGVAAAGPAGAGWFFTFAVIHVRYSRVKSQSSRRS